jgi:hypothetical protein
MKIVVSHRHTKRLIEGPFSLCASRSDMEQLRDALTQWLESEAVYGWIDIKENWEVGAENDWMIITSVRKQRSINDTPPTSWDAAIPESHR